MTKQRAKLYNLGARVERCINDRDRFRWHPQRPCSYCISFRGWPSTIRPAAREDQSCAGYLSVQAYALREPDEGVGRQCRCNRQPFVGPVPAAEDRDVERNQCATSWLDYRGVSLLQRTQQCIAHQPLRGSYYYNDTADQHESGEPPIPQGACKQADAHQYRCNRQRHEQPANEGFKCEHRIATLGGRLPPLPRSYGRPLSVH